MLNFFLENLFLQVIPVKEARPVQDEQQNLRKKIVIKVELLAAM